MRLCVYTLSVVCIITIHQFLDNLMKKTYVQDQSTSDIAQNYHDTFDKQVKLNEHFHTFVRQYEEAYRGKNYSEHQIKSHVKEKEYSEPGEELPLGPSFQELVCCFYE